MIRFRIANGLSWSEMFRQWQQRINPSLVIAAMLITVTVVILLSFIRVPSAEFSLSAKVDSLTLDPSGALDLDDLVTTSVDIAGIRSLEGSSEPGANATVALRIAPKDGVVTLSRLRIPRSWSITLEAESSEHQRILASPVLASAPNAFATVFIAVPKGSVMRFIDAENKSSERLAETDEDVFLALDRVDLSIALPARRWPIAVRLPISAVSLRRYEVDETGAGTTELADVGSIRSGHLWIDHVAGPPQDLGLLDRISILGINHGTASLLFEAGLWEIRARGDADDITNRPGTANESLKPSILTTILDNGTLKICIAVVSFFVGIKISSPRKEDQT